jgi:5-methylthioadenosine/S-adenosylhomocysteine deaminase
MLRKSNGEIMSILIKNTQLNGKETNIYIEGNRIIEIGGPLIEADTVISGNTQAAIPGLINTHTHAAMTLFRGYADDMELFEWLSKKIWPLEAKLTPDDVYWGTRLACLEMIKSGTTCFNDMYWHMLSAAQAVDDSGIRGVISGVVFDNFDPKKGEAEYLRSTSEIHELSDKTSSRVMPAFGPHAVYTVSNELLMKIAEQARKENILIHMHLAETEKENQDYMERTGKRPVELLSELGFFGPDVIAAHSVWFNNKDIETLGKFDVKTSHNPISNMKLAIGKAISYKVLTSAGVTVSLGTDGCASNNNLDMFESMKIATLLQKFQTNDQIVMPTTEVFDMATINGAKTLRLDAGIIAEGKLADLLLVDIKHPAMTPNHDLISNLVYSANGSVVNTMICDGKIVMQDRKVEGELEVIEKCREHATRLMNA